MKPLTTIQKFAKGKDCLLRIPGVCTVAPHNENVVLCHAPYPGRGGMRKDDWWACPGCFECHALLDGRTSAAKHNLFVIDQYGSSEAIWYPSIREWIQMLIDAGFIEIKRK